MNLDSDHSYNEMEMGDIDIETGIRTKHEHPYNWDIPRDEEAKGDESSGLIQLKRNEDDDDIARDQPDLVRRYICC